MFATLVRFSKASRRPLTGKRANKDYYKGTRQAYLPGGHRTGAPGKHVVGGKAKYRLVDEQVRVFVAPPVDEIENSALKPYVQLSVNLDKSEAPLARTPKGGLTGDVYSQLAPRKTGKELRQVIEANTAAPSKVGEANAASGVAQ